MGETIIVEPGGVTPTTSTKFCAMVTMKITTPMIKGMHAFNTAGGSHWMGFFFEKQAYKLCDECKAPGYDTNLCDKRKTRRINMEGPVKNFGPEVELVILPERDPQEIVNLFLQHGHQRRF